MIDQLYAPPFIGGARTTSGSRSPLSLRLERNGDDVGQSHHDLVAHMHMLETNRMLDLDSLFGAVGAFDHNGMFGVINGVYGGHNADRAAEG